MVRSFTDDPAAGRRFIVGMQTPANKGVLGFGLTPEEVAEQRSRQVAEQMGLAPELADASRYISPEKMSQFGVRSILEQQEQAAQDQRAEQTFQRGLEMKRAEQAKAQEQKEAKIAQLIEMGRGNAALGSPVQWEQMVQSNPDRAEQFLFQQKTNALSASQKAMEDAAKKAEQKQMAAAIAADYPPEIRAKLEAYVEEGAGEKVVRSRGNDLVKEMKATQKAQADAAEKQALIKQNEARFIGDDDALEDYRARVAAGLDPKIAVQEVKEKKEATAKAQADEKHAERQRMNDERKDARDDFNTLGAQIKDIRDAMKTEMDPEKLAEHEAELAKLQAMRDAAAKRYMKSPSVAPRNVTATRPVAGGVGKSSPPDAPGAGTPTAAASSAVVPPPAGAGAGAGTQPPPPGAAAPPQPGQRGELAPKGNMPETQKATMSVRPELLSKFVQIHGGLKQNDPERARAMKEEFRQIIAAAPMGRSEDAVQAAVAALLAKYGQDALMDFGD